MTYSTKTKRQTKAKKPRPDFPLFPHATGRWAKKVRGKSRYFGKIADDPKGEAALALWLEQKDDLLAGRTPRADRDGLTVAALCNSFLTAKERKRDAGELSPQAFSDYLRTCKILTDAFGRERLVDDLIADDFGRLRAALAKQYGVHRLANNVQRVRSVFKFGYDDGFIDKPVRFGSEFKRPKKRTVRLHRQKNGKRMFEAEQIRRLLDAASQPLKAMILLGINCGFGNNDCGTLPLSAVDLRGGWIDYPRPKTAVERRCPLWPETIEAIEEAAADRPAAKKSSDDGLVFLTKYGHSWSKETDDNPVAKEFRKLLDGIDEATATEAKKRRAKPPKKIYRKGVGFYALRHTFETIGGESRDQVAVDHIMGHVDASMASDYRERISDDRLRAVVDGIRAWLFSQPTVG